MNHILITGATGFLGSALIEWLAGEACYSVVAAVRREVPELTLGVRTVLVDGLEGNTEWLSALKGSDVLIHTAARVHVMNDSSSDPLAEFRKVNYEGTMNLARQAVQAGVKRFVFISSIKVNGEATELGRPFSADDVPEPVDPYGISKAETEQALLELGEATGLEVVIIRPVLVYGPGVKGNFATMMRWIDKGIPLPLGAVNNKRSLIALDNLVSFIALCVDHPKAANEIFLVSDGEDVSTTQLLRKVAGALNRPIRLLPIPVSWMVFCARLLGKQAVTDRLFGSLQVDSSKAWELLGWTPVITMDEQLKKMVES